MLNELCRLCGSKSNSTLDIFSEAGSQEKLELKIKEVVRLNILQEDPLPSIVCTICVKNLESTSHFIDRCHQTQKYLSQLYHDNSSLDNIIIPSDESNNTENAKTVTTNESNIEINTGIGSNLSTTCSFSNLKSGTINSSNILPKDRPTEKISKNNKSYADAYQNYITELSNTSTIKPQNNSLIQPTSSKRKNKSPAAKKKTNKRIIAVDKNSNRKSESTNPPNDRSRLRRKCTLKETPINNLNDSSREDDREHSEDCDDSFVLESTEEKEYDTSSQNTKKSCQKLNLLTTLNKENSSEKAVSKNSIMDEKLLSEGTEQNTTENTIIRTGFRSKNRFQCDICRKTFSQELTYQEHLNLHSGKRPFSCKLCTAAFRRRQELNQHLRTVHSEKQFKCPSCDHVAKHKGKLTEHIKSVHDKPFACDMCDYRTGEKGKIARHITNKHTADLSFVCEICGNGFKTKISLQVHIRNIHFPEPKVCQTCGTVCPSLAKYSSHIFRCGKEKKRYPCEKCGKTYVNKDILKDHMNKHLNIKPYKCDICGKEFFQRNRLDTHKYVHRGANYQCEICNQLFNRKDNMKNHMKRHFYKSIRCDNTIVTAV